MQPITISLIPRPLLHYDLTQNTTVSTQTMTMVKHQQEKLEPLLSLRSSGWITLNG